MAKSSFPIHRVGKGTTRQVLSERPELMVVRFEFLEAGAEGALHSHPHVQSTYVESGKFRFFVNGELIEVGPGDCLVVESGVEHGCVCIEPGTLIDSFTPRRDDFL